MDQTDLELPHSHNLLFWIIEILIEVSSYDVDVTSQSLEIVITLLGAKVSSAENVLDFPWHQELFEFRRQAVAAVWDVQIS